MCLLYKIQTFEKIVSVLNAWCLFLYVSVCVMCVTCICVCVCLSVVGRISVAGVLCGWTGRQHPAFNLTATIHRGRGGRDRKRERESDRKTEGEMWSWQCFSKYYKHAVLYCTYLTAEAIISLVYGYILAFKCLYLHTVHHCVGIKVPTMSHNVPGWRPMLHVISHLSVPSFLVTSLLSALLKRQKTPKNLNHQLTW